MDENRYKKVLAARGNQKIEVFNKAVDGLQHEGFQTQLWTIGSTLVFRWVKNSAKWHTVSRLQGNHRKAFEGIGRNVLAWLEARRTGSATETSYAVSED